MNICNNACMLQACDELYAIVHACYKHVINICNNACMYLLSTCTASEPVVAFFTSYSMNRKPYAPAKVVRLAHIHIASVRLTHTHTPSVRPTHIPSARLTHTYTPSVRLTPY